MLGWNGMASRTLAHPLPHPMGALSADNGCERTLQGVSPFRGNPQGAASQAISEHAAA